MFFSFPDLQAAHKYKSLYLKMKLGKDIWLPITWLNPYNFLTAVVKVSKARSQDFIKVWPEFAQLEQNCIAINPETVYSIPVIEK